MKKLKSPYFVKADLRNDGSVILIDDDGEQYHVMMKRYAAWPVMGKLIRQFEMRESYEKHLASNRESPEPPPPPQPPQRFELTFAKK